LSSFIKQPNGSAVYSGKEKTKGRVRATEAAEADLVTRERLTQYITLEMIRKEVMRKLQADEKDLEARTMLESMLKDAWCLQYGDYHATNLAALREETRDMVKKAKLAAAAEKMRSNKKARRIREKDSSQGQGSWWR
jgi:acyl-homoserine lactone acylase PvdQ